MANGRLDANGQPIIQNQESMSSNRMMGFTKIGLLVILTSIISMIILIIGIILEYK